MLPSRAEESSLYQCLKMFFTNWRASDIGYTLSKELATQSQSSSQDHHRRYIWRHRRNFLTPMSQILSSIHARLSWCQLPGHPDSIRNTILPDTTVRNIMVPMEGLSSSTWSIIMVPTGDYLEEPTLLMAHSTASWISEKTGIPSLLAWSVRYCLPRL